MSVVAPRTTGVLTGPVEPARSTLGRLLAVARALLVGAVLVAAGAALLRNWSQVQATVWQLPWTSWVPALVAAPAGIICATASWQNIVDGLGEPIGRRRGGQIFLVGQLGKYLPGSVWAYLLQMELGRRAGVSRARILAATVLSTAVAVVAALVAACVALPTLAQSDSGLGALLWLYLLIPVAVALLHPWVLKRVTRLGFRMLRREPPQHDLPVKNVAQALLWALGSYVCFGAHLWALASAVPGARPVSLSLCVGTMAVGMLAGVFFFLLPSGLGVREAVIVTALSPLIGPGPALAVAAVSRVFLTLADLITAGGAALLTRVTTPDSAAQAPTPL